MANGVKVAEGDYIILTRRIYLAHAHFVDLQGPEFTSSDEPTATEIQVSLGLTRPSESEMVVALTADTLPGTPYDISVTYAADYEIAATVPPAERDEHWRHLALQIAPGVLYPYLREFVTNLTSRSRAFTLNLPLIPLPLGVGESDFHLPEVLGSNTLDLFAEGDTAGVPEQSAESKPSQAKPKKRAPKKRGPNK